MLFEVATVVAITLIAVLAMINFKDYINRSEAVTAMQDIGKTVAQYQLKYGKVPSESVFLRARDSVKGSVRLPGLVYRGLWMSFEAEPNDILAYTEKDYPSSLLDDGYVVLRFDANAVWMGKAEFEALLAQQQSEVEIEMTRK